MPSTIKETELIQSSSQLRGALGNHFNIIRKFDPKSDERRKTNGLRTKLINQFGECCAICNSQIEIQAAHIVPLELGSTTEINNLILLCKDHHSLYDAGSISIDLMKQIRARWENGQKDFENVVFKSVQPDRNPTIIEPPESIKDTMNEVLKAQRERKFAKCIRLLTNRIERNRNISYLEKDLLFLKSAEISRRRDTRGSLDRALHYINKVDIYSLPKTYIPRYDYEKLYIYRLAGFHEAAYKVSSSSLKSLSGDVHGLEYVTASVMQLLCELARYRKPTTSQVQKMTNRLEKLEEIGRQHGGYWGGRWEFNCAAHKLTIYVKARDEDKSIQELKRVVEMYNSRDVATGWDSGGLQSVSLLNGLINVLYPSSQDELKRGIGLLARSFCARLRRSQRFEGIRDAGFGLAKGFRELGEHLETSDSLDHVIERTVDGTSYIWPWVRSTVSEPHQINGCK